jgi:DNA-directed RNA polymerase subunit RPC12/RpoP
MRCHQYIGLTEEAKKWLDENVQKIPDSQCPECGHVISTKMNSIVYSNEDQFYGDCLPLHRYKLTDGRFVAEVLQVQPWSSGPMSFLCLEIAGVREFQWGQDMINEY